MDMRIPSEERALKEIIDRAMMEMNTAIPGTIVSFDPATQTASVAPSITMRTNVSGKPGTMALPQIVNVPLVFPFASTAGFALTLPIQSGDPCLLIFSQRCFENWHELGGTQPPENGAGSRHHDITDAFAMLAPSPLPDVLGEWQLDGIEIRNRARNSFVKVTDTEVLVETTTVTVNCQNATVTASAMAAIYAPIINLGSSASSLLKIVTSTFMALFNNHRHSNVSTGTSNSGVPTVPMDSTHLTSTVSAD